MTRQQLINRLVRYEAKQIMYTATSVLTALGTASQAEKDALAAAVNAEDKNLLADIVFTLFDNRRKADALDIVNSKISNDKIDIDDVAAAINQEAV